MHPSPVIDVHQHLVRLDTLHMPVERWAPPGVTGVPWRSLYDGDVPDPAAYTAYLKAEGIDVALLLSEHSPRVTGIQPIEHNVPVAAHAPDRVGLIANVNPHLHFPVVDELQRQLDLGAVALKIHAVHGGFDPAAAELYLAYDRCVEAGVPVVVHCGTSNFAGADNARAEVTALAPIVRDFPELQLVLAHGGRGWSYDAAAWFALTYPNVWIELSGLPPRNLPRYFQRVGFERLAPRCIFGTDFPAIPGLAANVRGIRDLGLPADVEADVLWRNATRVYGFHRVPALARRVAALGG